MKGALVAAAMACLTSLCGCAPTGTAIPPVALSLAEAPQPSLVLPRFPRSAAAIPGAIEIATAGVKGEPVLARAAHQWLLAQMAELAQAYLIDAERIAALPSTSPWHQVERAWIHPGGDMVHFMDRASRIVRSLISRAVEIHIHANTR